MYSLLLLSLYDVSRKPVTGTLVSQFQSVVLAIFPISRVASQPSFSSNHCEVADLGHRGNVQYLGPVLVQYCTGKVKKDLEL